MSKTCSLATLGIWKKTDEPFEVYCSHHPRLVLFLSHCPSFQAARVCSQGLAELCPLLVCSSPGSVQPHPRSELDSSVLPARLPTAQAAAAGLQLSRLSNYLFSLYLVLRLALQPELLGFKPALFACRSEGVIHLLRSGVEMWTVEFGVNVYPLSRGLALHCPVHCTFLMNLFVFLCQLSYLNAKGFTLKIAQYEAPEEIAQLCGPQCHEYAGCVSWSVFPVLYPCFAQRTLLHFIICFLKEDCESLYGSPCTCDCSQK